MADSIEHGATIRIGFKGYETKTKGKLTPIPTYSLKIDKKTILNVGFAGKPDDYLDIYKNAAIRIANLMNNHKIEKYVLYNGERIRTEDKKWTHCAHIPEDGEIIFKRTLEEYLN